MKAWTNTLTLAAMAATLTLTAAACTEDAPRLIDAEDGPGPEANPHLVYDIIDLSCANGRDVSSIRFATLDDRNVFYRDAVAEKPYMVMQPRADLPPGSVPTWKPWQLNGETVAWVTVMGHTAILGSGPKDLDVMERFR